MAVYTHLDKDDYVIALADANLGEYQRHEGITAGVENTNYHVWTNEGRYILTVFEARIDADSLPFVFAYQHHLRDAGIQCPTVLYQGMIRNKPFAVATFLNGGGIDFPSKSQADLAGVYLAHMHLAADGFVQKRLNPMGIKMCQSLFDKTKDYMSEEQAIIVRDILDVPNHMNCPTGSIHADYFPDNVFFNSDGTNVTGVIDFYFSCTDYFIYDLAVAMNAWGHADAVVDGYQDVRPLTGHEKIWLPHMRRRAAVRIFLTRLYDWHNTPPNATVVKKDPVEYWELLEELK
jgi:homoserine kinase type II